MGEEDGEELPLLLVGARATGPVATLRPGEWGRPWGPLERLALQEER